MFRSLTAVAALALAIAAPCALAQPSALPGARVLIGEIGGPVPMEAATNVEASLRRMDESVAFSARFDTAVGGSAMLEADGPVDARGALAGRLFAGGVAYPATVWIKDRECDASGCWQTIEAEASNSAGEVVNVRVVAR